MRLLLCSFAVIALVSVPVRADVAPEGYDAVSGKAWGTLLESALAIQKLSSAEKKSPEDEKKITELNKLMDETVKPLNEKQRRVVSDLAGAYQFKQKRNAARDEEGKKRQAEVDKVVELINIKLKGKTSGLMPLNSGGAPMREGLAGAALAAVLMLAGLMFVRQRTA